MVYYTHQKASAVITTPERDCEDYQASDNSTFFNYRCTWFYQDEGTLYETQSDNLAITYTQLLNSTQCTPTYCNLEPGSNRISVGLRNASAKKITIPAKAVICQVQLMNLVPQLYAPAG